jgi:hypothetical protein
VTVLDERTGRAEAELTLVLGAERGRTSAVRIERRERGTALGAEFGSGRGGNRGQRPEVRGRRGMGRGGDYGTTDYGTADYGTADYGTTGCGTTDHGITDSGTTDNGTGRSNSQRL